MNLFEYQGKRLYQDFSIPTPKSIFVSSISEISDNHGLTYPVVVKAQVQVGGRGKAGGIKVAKNFDELTKFSGEILGMDIKGHIVESLLLEEASDILEEYYISFTLDRSAKSYLMMLSAKGGMDIEEVAEKNPDDLIMLHISPSKGLDSETIIKSIEDAKLNESYKAELSDVISNLYKLFVEGDCDLVEVNPLAITDNGVSALDSKVSLDMNAIYRHENFKDLENEIRIIAKEISNGNVWNTKDFITTRGGFMQKNYTYPIVIEEKTDIEIVGKASATSAISAGFEFFLEDYH